MRLKSYSAATMAQAMALVRRDMGDEAVIISSTAATEDGSVRVTAALDTQSDVALDALAFPAAAPIAAGDRGVLDGLVSVLNEHGAPIGVIDSLFDRLAAGDHPDAAGRLSAALANRFRFAPLDGRVGAGRPLLLVGPPGGGKTTTVAKLAAQARFNGRPVDLISADGARAGASAQLAALAHILGAPLKLVTEPTALAGACAAARPEALVLIDAAATNPLALAATADLKALATAAGAEPILVLAAGGDATEMAETATAFIAVGAARMIVTRLDAARRYGGVLSAGAAGLAFAAASATPALAEGLVPLDSSGLARFLLERRSRAPTPAAWENP